MKKIISISLSIILLITCVSFADKKEDLNKVQNEIKNIRNQKETKNSKISTLNESILDLDNKILNIQNKLSQTQNKLDETQKDINENNKKIDLKKQEIQELTQALKNRVRVMSKMKNIDYLQVLFSSKNLKDFFSNYTIIKKIVKQDKDNVNRLEKAKVELIQISSKLDRQKKSLDALKSDYNIQSKNLKTAKDSQEQNIKSLKNDLASLEQIENLKVQEANEISNQIRAATSSTQAYKGNYSGGRLGYPVYAPNIVSGYGYRTHPILGIKKLHTGVDFAANSGAPILAAESGRVIYSGPKSTYGNVVMIDHGSGIATLYAHCSVLYVKIGDIVSRGQKIAGVGSTGRSTGPHLHFEVRVNGDYTDPMPYL